MTLLKMVLLPYFEVAVIVAMVNLPTIETRGLDCVISFDDDKVVYGIADQNITCKIQNIDGNLYSLNINKSNAEWLEYRAHDQLITGVPKKENVGQSDILVTVQSHTCSALVPWTMLITFIIELPKYADVITDSCSNRPRVNRPVNHIQTRTGEMFKIKLDPLTFLDVEDGTTQDLKISLKTLLNEDLPEKFWLKFDETSLELYGVPIRNGLDMFVVNLIAEDRCKQIAVDSIRLEVKDDIDFYNHEFSVQFGVRSGMDIDVYKFIRGLLQWLDIDDPSFLYVSHVISDSDFQSISWVDKSLAGDICERKKILNTYYQMADENGTVQEEFMCFFSPFYNITAVFVDFKDVCNVTDIFFPVSNPESSTGNDNMYLFYILIPVAILTVIILIVIIILLVRRCLKRKQYVTNSEKPIFLMDRQPVIFQNEYNDEEMTLKPQSPLVIDNYDDSPSSRIDGTNERATTNPPAYVPETYADPPQYRLPPPYHISGL